MKFVRVRGVSDGKYGRVYKLEKVDEDGDLLADEVIVEDSFLLSEISAPDAPAANKAVLYCRDNGSGKTQVVVRFPTGAVQVVATEP